MDTKSACFKPYYKWIVLNTAVEKGKKEGYLCFKPYYKWIVLNTGTTSIKASNNQIPLF